MRQRNLAIVAALQSTFTCLFRSSSQLPFRKDIRRFGSSSLFALSIFSQSTRRNRIVTGALSKGRFRVDSVGMAPGGDTPAPTPSNMGSIMPGWFSEIGSMWPGLCIFSQRFPSFKILACSQCPVPALVVPFCLDLSAP